MNNNVNQYLYDIKKIKVPSFNVNYFEDWISMLGNSRFNCVHVNVQSLKRKWDEVLMIFDKYLRKLDVIVFTETHLNEEEAEVYKFKNFHQFSFSRSSRKGGGIIVYVRDSFKTERLFYTFDETENVILKITNMLTKEEITLISIYRPPNNNVSRFIQDLNWWLQMTVKKNETVIMLGDMNVCTIKRNNVNSNYLNVLYNNNLIPTVKRPTRECILGDNVTSSCIDHINVKIKNYNLLTSVIIEERIADHYMTGIMISKEKPVYIQKENDVKVVQVIIEKKLHEEINKLHWEECNNIDDPTLLYEAIYDKFKILYSKSVKMFGKQIKIFYLLGLIIK